MKQETKCPFCKASISGGLLFQCFGCSGMHHRDCWVEARNKCSSCKTHTPIEAAPSVLKKTFEDLVVSFASGLKRMSKPAGALAFALLLLAANLALVYNVNFNQLSNGQDLLVGLSSFAMFVGMLIAGGTGLSWMCDL